MDYRVIYPIYYRQFVGHLGGRRLFARQGPRVVLAGVGGALFRQCGLFGTVVPHPKGMRVWKLEPFEVYRQAGQCLWENSSAPVCRAVFSTRQNVFRIFQGAPLQDEWLNIVFFMPLGFLWPLLWPKKGWKSAVLGGFLLSLLVEVLQALTRRGVFETDDLINNTLGALLGYGLYRLLARPAVAPK